MLRGCERDTSMVTLRRHHATAGYCGEGFYPSTLWLSLYHDTPRNWFEGERRSASTLPAVGFRFKALVIHLHAAVEGRAAPSPFLTTGVKGKEGHGSNLPTWDLFSGNGRDRMPQGLRGSVTLCSCNKL